MPPWGKTSPTVFPKITTRYIVIVTMDYIDESDVEVEA